ncbi:fasciclin domain-containing protein [Vannielia litorea]|uniref:Uncaracterized surface protein containing fasciclin (FAS1) repeats n=1 Tax=Vannielia litorea TaxID=1217970 RepID=A0A1N6G420_9RHOB|nr:fasciclin domain-containing protein [Vannielia litorea]SIO02295.1 Uncaracterized surface protein containing fasciclin (FAS1) repeats [Vannielia litorea]
MLRTLTLAATAALSASVAMAANPTVGGAPMLESKNIVENAVNSPIHTTLVAAVKQAGLVDTLMSEGPFTVFAPTDAAFAMVKPESLAALMQPAAKKQLTEILTCHVVGAKAMSTAIAGMIADDGGTHPVATLGGCTLQAKMTNGKITLTDENGRMATVTVADVEQSNGVIHVIDRVLLPKQ